MTQLRQILALNIKKYRALRGLSQMKLAEKTDTAANYIAMIERGKKFPSDRVLEKIADAFGINAADLFSYQADELINVQVDIVKDIHREILNDITLFMLKRMEEIEKNNSPQNLDKITRKCQYLIRKENDHNA